MLFVRLFVSAVMQAGGRGGEGGEGAHEILPRQKLAGECALK